jgi:hypothetical protein
LIVMAVKAVPKDLEAHHSEAGEVSLG